MSETRDRIDYWIREAEHWRRVADTLTEALRATHRLALQQGYDFPDELADAENTQAALALYEQTRKGTDGD